MNENWMKIHQKIKKNANIKKLKTRRCEDWPRVYRVSKESIGNCRSSSDFNENLMKIHKKKMQDGRHAAILNIKNLFEILRANFQTN